MRARTRLDRMRDRHWLSKFCLRHGRLLPTSGWTVLRRKWLGEQRFEHPAEQITFDSYLHAVDLVDVRIEQLERAIRETSEQNPWRELVARLRCLRGIDTLSALGLVAEIGDFDRFGSAAELMALPAASLPALAADGRPRQATAEDRRRLARELAGFVWAIATEQTRECQSDPPSLLRTLRCSRPRGTPHDRASPLDLLLHVRAPSLTLPGS
ncbi:MAG: hypothetical protein WKF41_13085 [Gaiellaceae bacterium]